VRGGLVALLVLVLFVTIAAFPRSRPDPSGPAVKGPDDWYNLVRLAAAAFVVCAAGTFVYRRTSSRPLVLALALGLVFIGLDSLAVIDQVAAQAGRLPPQELINGLRDARGAGWNGVSPQRRNMMERAAGEVVAGVFDLARHRRGLYCGYYGAYVSWAVVIIYAGYLGQFALDRLVYRGERRRRESALYVAENAGIGLSAAVASGVAAIALSSILAAWAGSGTGFVREIGLPEISGARTPDAGAAPESEAPSPAYAPRPNPRTAAAGQTDPGTARLNRLRLYALLVFICFFAAAYITALVVRPRTSTWVACGALVGVLLLPAVGAAVSRDPMAFAQGFRLLELSPFTLAGLAVAAALLGDWLGRQIVARARAQSSERVMRPL